MNLTFSVSVYLVIWWTVLFGVLPLGNRTHAEMGVDLGDGGDPGAPVNPNLRRKFLTTTWIAAIVFAFVWVAYAVYVHYAGAPGPSGE